MPSFYLHEINSAASIILVWFCSYDPEQFAGTHTPILVIGTKLDQAQVVRENALKRSSSIAEECGADEINLVRIPSSQILRFLFVLALTQSCSFLPYVTVHV